MVKIRDVEIDRNVALKYIKNGNELDNIDGYYANGMCTWLMTIDLDLVDFDSGRRPKPLCDYFLK